MPKVTRPRTTHRWSPVAEEHGLRARRIKASRHAVLHWGDVLVDNKSLGCRDAVKEKRRRDFAVKKIVEAGKVIGWTKVEDVVVDVLAARTILNPAAPDTGELELLKNQMANMRLEMERMQCRIASLEVQAPGFEINGQTVPEPPAIPMEIDGPEDEMPEEKGKAKAEEPSPAIASVSGDKRPEEKGKGKVVEASPDNASVAAEGSSAQSKPIPGQGEGGCSMVINPGRPGRSSAQRSGEKIENEVSQLISKWAEGFGNKALTTEPEQLPEGCKNLLGCAKQASDADGQPTQAHVALRIMTEGAQRLAQMRRPMNGAFAELAQSAADLSEVPIGQKGASKGFAKCLSSVLKLLAGRPIVKREGALKQGVKSYVHDVMHKLSDLFPDETLDESLCTDLYARALQATLAYYAGQVRVQFPDLITTDRELDHVPMTLDYSESSRSE
ncbi:MAG: hypothetical protein M1831_003043 [Alyxoria varia]|nr:MAG: hypothetical protein M1831_003043 [Alyxoria varia]